MFKNLVNNLAVSIPIEEAMLQAFLQPKMSELSDVKVEISNGQLILSGTKKVGIAFFSKKILVRLTLVPKEAQGRKLIFNVVKVEPSDRETLNDKFLSHPPYVSYEMRTLTIDLSTMALLQKVKVGNIKSLSLEEGRVLVMVGA